MSDRTAGIRVKIERAKEHIGDLVTEFDSFLKTNPYLLIPQTDLQTGESVVRVRVRTQPPLRFGAIAGDAIHNLRAVFDLLVYQLVLANGVCAPGPNVKLPIADHPNKFESYLRKIHGLSEEAVRLIQGLRPYKGGNDLLWTLHRLDIIDKHHVLLLIGGASYVIRTDPERSLDFARRNFPHDSIMEWLLPFRVITPSSKVLHTLEDDTELFRGHIQPGQMHMKPYFSFDIAFGEPEVVKGQSVIATLHQFANLVERAVEPFLPLLT